MITFRRQRFWVTEILGHSAVAQGVTGAAVLEKRRRKRESERAFDEVLRTSTWLDHDDDSDSKLDRFFESTDDEMISLLVAVGEKPHSDGAALQASYQQRGQTAVTIVSRDPVGVRTMPWPPHQSVGVAQSSHKHASSTTRNQPVALSALTTNAKRTKLSKPLLWLMPWLLVAAACFGIAMFNNDDDARTASTSHDSIVKTRQTALNTQPKYITQKIRDLPTGTWVLADNPETDIESDFGEVVPAGWRKLLLRMVKEDSGTLEIELLRPLWWLQDHRVTQAGDMVELDLEELGAAGLAAVLKIEPCPPVESRPSAKHRLVTGKFTHSSARVLDLFVDGLQDPIRVTDSHPFWSEDRQQFVPAGQLQVNERGEQR